MRRSQSVQTVKAAQMAKGFIANFVRHPHTCAMTASTGDPAATASTTHSPPPGAQGDIPADTFGARLVLARYHAGRLSIEKAAEKCGLNSGNWVRWEDGALPRDKVEVAQAISDGLGINFNWLLLGGPLLSARGRPTGKVSANRVTPEYPYDAEWILGDGSAVADGPRRPRLIDRTHLAAA